MNNAIKKIALISDYFNLYLITLFIFFIKTQLFSYYQIIWEYQRSGEIINIEDCLPTSANGSKDRDDLLRLLGVLQKQFWGDINWVSPKYTKSVVKNIKNLSKYNDSCLWKFEKDTNLTYQYGKGWKYNNQKISNYLRDAIIIANYEN
ncbi:hypothetical protein [Spiroplasma phoeniceum]|uniref:Uncharacterized protein n=1 Tax=Spiroplasma phoeniceum P40 TaxID=1276259 RepID=A0A345DLT5_9MOLU|nr:hypothetical protein [Spiroplasma phoeniceum]AXF95173.1 hypothetical protein SDAV_00178 [Spiroplasma phoeniceum P40]